MFCINPRLRGRTRVKRVTFFFTPVVDVVVVVHSKTPKKKAVYFFGRDIGKATLALFTTYPNNSLLLLLRLSNSEVGLRLLNNQFKRRLVEKMISKRVQDISINAMFILYERLAQTSNGIDVNLRLRMLYILRSAF